METLAVECRDVAACGPPRILMPNAAQMPSTMPARMKRPGRLTVSVEPTDRGDGTSDGRVAARFMRGLLLRRRNVRDGSQQYCPPRSLSAFGYLWMMILARCPKNVHAFVPKRQSKRQYPHRTRRSGSW